MGNRRRPLRWSWRRIYGAGPDLLLKDYPSAFHGHRKGSNPRCLRRRISDRPSSDLPARTHLFVLDIKLAQATQFGPTVGGATWPQSRSRRRGNYALADAECGARREISEGPFLERYAEREDQRTQRHRSAMSVRDWLDAALTVAHGDGSVAAKHAPAPASAWTAQAECVQCRL